MSIVYFHKNGRTGIQYSNGAPIEFTRLADQRGVLSLDTEKDEKKVADLREFIKRRIGGVSEIDQAQFEDLKKNLPYDRSKTFAGQQNTRLFQPKVPSSKSKAPQLEPVRTATAQASAGLAVDGSPAEGAAAQAEGSRPPRPTQSRGRKLNVGVPKVAGAPAPAPAAEPAPVVATEPAPVVESAPAPTPMPVAEGSVNLNPATTE